MSAGWEGIFCLAPAGRILRLAFFANLEIKTRSTLSTAAANAADNFAGINPFPRTFAQRFIVPVERQIGITVIDDDKVPEPTQPVGKGDTAMRNRLYVAATLRLDSDSLPTQVRCRLVPAKQSSDLAFDRPGEFAFQRGEGLL